MTPERCERIKEVLEAALSRKAEERPAFLAKACHGDKTLQSEIDKLLTETERTGSFTPAPGLGESGIWPESDTNLERIGDYRIERLLGRGGMGSVYQAYEESMHRLVALKVLSPALIAAGGETSRFEREAWIAGRLSHPNIVKVYGQGVATGAHYIAMELVDGASLSAEIRRIKEKTAEKPESKWHAQHISRVVSLFIGVADALQHVHENGIVHRDIKPQNLLLTKDSSRLLLTDFGLAHDEQTAQLTRRGDFMGTIRYMSPEQLLAHRARVDHRTDIWSFGVSLYEALTLEFPYSGDTEEAYIGAVSTKEALPARTRNRLVPRDIETILMKCLERDPERRYPTAAELKADLMRFLEVQPVLARRPGPLMKLGRFGQRHRSVLAVAILSSVFVFSVLMALVRWQNGRKQTERIRWVLQQTITSRAEPKTLDPNWDQLSEKLRSEVQRNPTGELALLANRAAVRLEVSLPSFGLLSDPPDLGFGAKEVVFLGQRFLFLADLEARLDNGPWKPMGSIVVNGDAQEFGNMMYGQPLTQFFPGLSPVPHRLDFRAVCKLLNAAIVSASEIQQIFGSAGNRIRVIAGPNQNTWPGIRKPGMALFTEARSVGSFQTNLFRRYPEDFPHKVFELPGAKPIDTYFHPKRVRILRLKLPESSATGVTYTWPAEHHSNKTYCLSKGDIRNDQVIGVELFGRMDPHIPVPLAADAKLYVDRVAGPLLSFPIAFGLGTELANPWYQPQTESEADEEWAKLGFPKSAVRSEDRIQRQDDQIIGGYLTLTPSRAIALGTRWFDYYFARPLSIPMQIEIRTLSATAVDFKNCSSTNR